MHAWVTFLTRGFFFVIFLIPLRPTLAATVQPGVLQFESAIYHATEGGLDAVLTVVRSAGTNGGVSVGFASIDGTAIMGQDYAGTNGSLIFGDTETRKTIVVRISEDDVMEGTETLQVTLVNPVGATLGNPATATVYIVEGSQVLTTCNEAELRAAVSAGGRVTLACDGTLFLTSPLMVSNALILEATGHELTLSGSNTTRLFKVCPGASLRLVNLTLVDGLSEGTNGLGTINLPTIPPTTLPPGPGGPGRGGAILNDVGNLLIEKSRVLRNKSRGGRGGNAGQFSTPGTGGPGLGGGIFTSGGTLFVMDSVLAENLSQGGQGGDFPGLNGGAGGDASGGAIHSDSTLVELSDSEFTNSSATPGEPGNTPRNLSSGNARGGALFQQGGTLRVERSQFVANHAGGGYRFPNAEGANALGGAIFSHGAIGSFAQCRFENNAARAGFGTLRSMQSGNAAFASGGAIFVGGGLVTFDQSSFAANKAIGGDAYTSFSNLASGGAAHGGGICSTGSVQLINCTLADNQAHGGDLASVGPGRPGEAFGGALCNLAGTMELIHVTLANNAVFVGTGGTVSSVFAGGGLFSTNGGVSLFNSVLAGSPSGSNCFGTVIDGGHNISSDASCNFTAPGSLNNTDPVLGPLADYGGATPTMALLAGSPAIDTADTLSCPATDQRGITRPFGAGCDIGAFESSPPYTILGRVTGFLPSSDAIRLTADSSSTLVDTNGNFTLHGLSTGDYLLTPSTPDAVFVLSNRLVNLGPDAVGVTFHSYRTNALFIEQIAVGAVRAVFASEAGRTFRVEVSQDASAWLPYLTNTTETSGLFKFLDTNSVVAQPRLFRVLKL